MPRSLDLNLDPSTQTPDSRIRHHPNLWSWTSQISDKDVRERGYELKGYARVGQCESVAPREQGYAGTMLRGNDAAREVLLMGY